MTILVVDDSEDGLDAMALGLRFEGFHVETASGGLCAITKARQCLPDLIVMDLCMPDVDGWEAIREIKASHRTRHIPIIALTALSDHWTRTKAEAAGCDAYLQKPCTVEDLAAEIHRLCEVASAP